MQNELPHKDDRFEHSNEAFDYQIFEDLFVPFFILANILSKFLFSIQNQLLKVSIYLIGYVCLMFIFFILDSFIFALLLILL